MSYVAYYAPAHDGQEDPTKEFPTESEAWDYVYSRMCRTCKEERQRALSGDAESSLDPACSCEWFVITKEDWDASESFMDILEAAGYTEVIYRRPEDGLDIDGAAATEGGG